MKKELSIVFLLVFWSFAACGQQRLIDSLHLVLKNTPQQTNKRLIVLNNLCNHITNKKYFLEYNDQAIALSKQLKKQRHLARAYKLRGTYHNHKGQPVQAIVLFNKSLKISQEQNDSLLMSSTLERLGITYRKQGRIVKSLQSYEAALKLLPKINTVSRTASIYLNLGVLYSSQKKYVQSIEYYHKSLNLYKNPAFSKKHSYIAVLNNNIGVAYYYTKDYAQAQIYYRKALKFYKSSNNQKSAIITIGNINLAKGKQKKYLVAIDELQMVIDSLDHWNAKFHQSLFLQELGNLYKETNSFNKADISLKKALALAKNMQALQRQVAILNHLHQLHKLQGNFKAALQYLEIHNTLKDSIFNKKYKRQIANLESSLHLKEKEQLNQLQASELREKNLQLSRQFIIIASIVGILLLMLAIALLFYWQRQQKQKTNQELQEKNEEIQTANEEIQASHEHVEDINKNIMASITYAQRIQKAILPSYHDIQGAFPESFIFYKPRDIVSGDFYWFTQTDPVPIYEKNSGFEVGKVLKGFTDEKQVLVIADCTGHGVPGAFMTMLCTQALNSIVIQGNVHAPEKILQQLDAYLKNALRSEQTNVKDGMDMTICVIDHAEKTLTFAGAKNSLIYWKENTLHEIKGAVFSINNYAEDTHRFEAHTIDISLPVTFYMYSDGYQDQFGGANGKKFMKKRFRELLGNMVPLPVVQQKTMLETTLNNWMGNTEQVDDILVMGVKLMG